MSFPESSKGGDFGLEAYGREHSSIAACEEVAGGLETVGMSLPVSGLPEPQKNHPSRHPQGVEDEMTGAQAPAPFLDSLKHNCNRPLEILEPRPRIYVAPPRRGCGKWSLVGTIGERSEKFLRLGCKAWKCPRCGPKKAKRVKKGIITAAQGKNLCRLLTLTLDPRRCTVEESPPYIKEVWRKMRQSFSRELGKTVEFICVMEFQQNGYAHLHVLLSHYVSQAWIKASWQSLGGGQIVDIRQVDMHRIAGYVSKYLTKEMILGQQTKRYRRYTTSRGIQLFEKAVKGLWKIIKTPLHVLKQSYQALIVDESTAEDGILESFEIARGEA